MKRRDFLRSPALGLLFPAGAAFDLLGRPLSAAGLLPGEPVPGEQDGTQPRFVQRLHQDFVTFAPGIEYFFLGNGEIQAAVQYAPDRSGELPQTYLGVTLMDAERFARKWSTFLFDPERGFQRTVLHAVVDGKDVTASPENLKSIAWTVHDEIPAVALSWRAGSCEITEEYWVPWREPLLFRDVAVRNLAAGAHPVRLWLSMNPNFALFDEIGPREKERAVTGDGFAAIRLQSLEPATKTSGRYDLAVELGEIPPAVSRAARLVYAIGSGARPVDPKRAARLRGETSGYWREKTSLRTGNDQLDHLFAVCRTGIRSNVARSGKRDSGTWMYNMEWVRDDTMLTVGALQAGFPEVAKALLTKNFERSVGPDGRTIESSRWFGYDYTELDQNGQLLYGLWAYLCWTGDLDFARKYWAKVVHVAEFPLQDRFLDPKAHMVRNKREFWERSDSFGVEDGFELAYQFWLALGLERGGEVAALLGKQAQARAWHAAADSIRNAIFTDPAFRLVEDGHLIKRRNREGIWQRFMVPPNRASMPPGSPIATGAKPECDPDSAEAYPVVFGMVDPGSDLARNTLQWLEQLWSQRWDFGGYSRYNVSSEPDPPAPWPLVTLLMARAYVETGNWEKMWRAVRWINEIHGGKSGGWFERYGPSITPPAPPVCVVSWTWSEGMALLVQHIAGVRPGLKSLTLRPRMPSGIETLEGTFPVRRAHLHLRARRGEAARPGGGEPYALVDGKRTALTGGALTLDYPRAGSTLDVEMVL